jgi:hypothetical protein
MLGYLISVNKIRRNWIAGEGYSFALDGDTIIARNAKGRELKTVPAKAKKLPEFEQLDNLRVFLAQHKKHCRSEVTGWFLKGLPVPLTVVAAVWPDAMWRSYLKDLVVTVQPDGPAGLLREVDDQQVRIVDLDGETLKLPLHQDTTMLINHPAVLTDIEEWREFAVELGIVQGIDQLFRDLYTKPSDEQSYHKAISAYSDGTYDKAAVLLGRSRSGGFATSLQEVSVVVVEDGEETTASLDVNAWDPLEDAHIGHVHFYREGKPLALADIGPIAWSEGIRMAAFVYAGRSVDVAKDNS